MRERGKLWCCCSCSPVARWMDGDSWCHPGCPWSQFHTTFYLPYPYRTRLHLLVATTCLPLSFSVCFHLHWQLVMCPWCDSSVHCVFSKWYKHHGKLLAGRGEAGQFSSCAAEVVRCDLWGCGSGMRRVGKLWVGLETYPTSQHAMIAPVCLCVTVYGIAFVIRPWQQLRQRVLIFLGTFKVGFWRGSHSDCDWQWWCPSSDAVRESPMQGGGGGTARMDIFQSQTEVRWWQELFLAPSIFKVQGGNSKVHSSGIPFQWIPSINSRMRGFHWNEESQKWHFWQSPLPICIPLESTRIWQKYVGHLRPQNSLELVIEGDIVLCSPTRHQFLHEHIIITCTLGLSRVWKPVWVAGRVHQGKSMGWIFQPSPYPYPWCEWAGYPPSWWWVSVVEFELWSTVFIMVDLVSTTSTTFLCTQWTWQDTSKGK